MRDGREPSSRPTISCSRRSTKRFPGIDWKKLADYTSGRVVVHGERRAREMEEVAETLRAIGVDPIMAEATARRQDWSAQMDLRSQFGPEGPETYRDVLDAIVGGHQPRIFANMSGAQIVASDSMMNLGVSTPSLPHVIFSFGTAPEYEP